MDCTPEEGQHLLWSRLNMRETSREPLLSTNKYDDDSTKESLSDDGSNSMLDTGFHYQSATRSRRLRVVVAALGCLTACCLIASATLYLGYRLGLRNPHPTVLMPNADASCAVQWKALASPDNPSVETVLSADRDQSSIVFTNGTVYDRPAGLKIVAVVFCTYCPPLLASPRLANRCADGRREYASILDCYLRRNLAVNGGILDEVRFVVHTQDEEDRRWLEDLVHDQDLEDHYILQYEATENDKWTLWHTFRYIWSTMTDPDTIYIKIDDDIVSFSVY